MFASHLRQLNEIWGNFSITKLEYLQCLQNRAQSLMEGSMLKGGWKCTWLLVSNLIKLDRVILMHGHSPVNLERDLLPDLKYLDIEQEMNLILIS